MSHAGLFEEMPLATEREVERRDFSKMMLPMPIVWTLIITSVGAAGGVWTVLAQVNVISAQMTAAKELSAEQMNNLKESVVSMRNRQELQQYEIQQLKDTVQELKTLMKGERP